MTEPQVRQDWVLEVKLETAAQEENDRLAGSMQQQGAIGTFLLEKRTHQVN